MEEEKNVEQEQNNKSSKDKKAFGIINMALPVKTKVIIVLITLAVTLLFFIILCGAAYVAIGGLDKEEGEGGADFSSIGDNSGFWWPVGSATTTTKNGVTFASGEPAVKSVSSSFGPRTSPTAGASTDHRGIDIPSANGAGNVIASKAGKVITVDNGCTSKRGCYVKIDHGNNYYTLYQHLKRGSIRVKNGDTVEQGQVIATIGNTGVGTGPHLHFEMYVGGSVWPTNTVNPLTYVDPNNPRPVSSGSGYTKGDNVKQTVCLSLKKSGFNDTSVAAIMGNMWSESRFDPGAINYIDCHGLVQWCYDRKNNLLATYGNAWSQVDNQLEFMLAEYNGDHFYSNLRKYFSEDHSAGDKAYKFCVVFERPEPGVCPSGERQRMAESFLGYVKNGCK